MRCADTLVRLTSDYAARFAGSGPYEPLQALLGMLAAINAAAGLCQPCCTAVRTKINEEMETLWDDLWEIFSLDQKDGEGEYFPRVVARMT